MAETISVRVDNETKKLLWAIAYHDSGARRPKDVNLSNWIRDALKNLIDEFADQHSGGKESLLLELKQGQIAQAEESLRELEGFGLEGQHSNGEMRDKTIDLTEVSSLGSVVEVEEDELGRDYVADLLGGRR